MNNYTNPPALQKKLAAIEEAADERDAERRAKREGGTYLDLHKTPVSVDAVQLVPEEMSRAAHAVVIQNKGFEVALAANHPEAPKVKEVVEYLKQNHYQSKVFYVSKNGLEKAWQMYRYAPQKGKQITSKVDIERKHLDELMQSLTTLPSVQKALDKTEEEHASTTTLMETLLAGALNLRASDIHLEAEEKVARVRYRVDGLLHDVSDNLPAKAYESLMTRIKLLSNLKMNVHGEPQDGRFTIGLPGKDVEMRVSIIPSEFGETVVMRVLDPEATKVSLAQLGLRPDDFGVVEQELAKPNGLILNTGPTGSGKTTTLYAFLRHLSNPEIKIITVEDPIEYRIEHVEQTQVNPEVGYTFAGGLRAILRQDPDAILVGEIRDKETADMAMQASLTGHMVLSTLHANDAIGAVPRLMDLGVRSQTIGPALSLIIAQRLVRVLCDSCKKAVEISPDLADKIEKFKKSLPAKIDQSSLANPKIFEPVGCEKCSGFGYKGRIGIFEFLAAGARMEEVILKEASEVSLRALAKEQGMVSMQQDGLIKVLFGQTSLNEVAGVTGPIVWSE